MPLLDMPVKAFVVLYFHDVVGLNAAFANVTLIIIIAGTLVGRLLLSWVLQLMSGVLLLRLSVWFGLMSFALFLLVPFVTVKLVMLAVFSLVEADWYPLAKGQAYAAQPTRSGVVLSVTSLLSPITSLLPLVVGFIASQVGLGWGMGVMLVGPVVAGVLLLRG
ncbi:MAG: MFS transporter [Chloroflexi bacterium]|nr:MAG: MFS transporter [Chloroflexota bacterium]